MQTLDKLKARMLGVQVPIVVGEREFIVQRALPGEVSTVDEVRVKLARFRAERPDVATWLDNRLDGELLGLPPVDEGLR